MLKFYMLGTRWRLSLLFPSMVTALLLWQPDGLALPCVLASLIHEGGHLLAMLVMGTPPQDFTLGIFGARMRMNYGTMTYWQNVAISLSGPLMNIISAVVLWLLHQSTPALVHVLLAAMNLLPAVGLDGGEILRCLLCLLGLESRSAVVLTITSVLVLLPLATSGIYALLSHTGNGSLLVISLYLAMLIFFADKNEKNS